MDGQPFKSIEEVAESLGVPHDCEMHRPAAYLTHGPPEYDSMRERIVPMISEAMKRTPLLGLDLIGWDLMIIPMANATLLQGVAIAVRGVHLTGPGKELMQ